MKKISLSGLAGMSLLAVVLFPAHASANPKADSENEVKNHLIESKKLNTKGKKRKIRKIFTCDQYSSKTLEKKAKRFESTIRKMASKHNVSANLIKAVIAVETCFNPKAISPVGARGLMQLMPATAKRYKVRDRFNIHQNINGGTNYLKFLIKRYDGNLRFAIAAYNAGEGNVDKHKGIPPFRETQSYVKKVMRAYYKLTSKRNVVF